MSVFGETAAAIARRLAEEAIWHEGRCNWVGPEPELGGRKVSGVRSLAPDLYGGTAGVGLVLAEVAAVTADRRCGKVAVGAVRQALSATDRLDPELAPGFFGGLPGIALAAIRTGLLLGQNDLVDAGRAIAAPAPLHPSATSDDLVGGRAGGVIGLLLVGAALSESEPLSAAVELAGGPDPLGYDDEVGPPGLAHGAAGVSWALLELWAATGVERFRNAAADAWEHERERLEMISGVTSEVSWCNGPPGIALGRHRAWALTGDQQGRVDAARALETTAAWSRAGLRSLRGSYCLCHGLAGNAEVLAGCADAAGGRAPELRALAAEVASAGIDEYAAPGRPWPCGWPGGESPGLMIGLAGVARFYLRVDYPSLPSILLPRPTDDWAGSGRGDQGSASIAAAALMRP